MPILSRSWYQIYPKGKRPLSKYPSLISPIELSMHWLTFVQTVLLSPGFTVDQKRVKAKMIQSLLLLKDSKSNTALSVLALSQLLYSTSVRQRFNQRFDVYQNGVRLWFSPTGQGIRGPDSQSRCGGGFTCPRSRNGGSIHNSIDYRAVLGQPIRAITSGTVIKIGYMKYEAKTPSKQLKYIEISTQTSDPVLHIKHGYVTPLDHLKVGDFVVAGQIIGHYLKSLVNVYGSGITEHVHVEIRKNGQLVNPELYIRF